MRHGVEVPEGTAVYAAWLRGIRAMHQSSTTAAAGVAVVAGPAAEAVVAAAAAGPAVGPVQLRPFREHRVKRLGDFVFCLHCFGKAPRYKAAEWRASCCDGDAPIGACPKHLLSATCVGSQGLEVQGGQEGQAGSRLHELRPAAKSWHSSLAAKALRPPKRRAGPRQPPHPDPVAGTRGRLHGAGR